MNPDSEVDAVSGADPLAPDAQQGTEPLACVSCRARKLKCDRTKPACSRCVKVDNECVYPESRRKPTFKRKNVKELEARLAQVEDYLKEVTKNPEDESPKSGGPSTSSGSYQAGSTSGTEQSGSAKAQPGGLPDFSVPLQDPSYKYGSGQLMDLGISESLPPFEVMEELNSIFFNFHHVHIPIVHPGLFWQSFYGSPLRKPPMCLQYAMWALASHLHEKFASLSEIFYQRARQYAEADEMKGIGEHFITVSHAQAYAIIATFEAKRMLFTRAALTSAKCIRLVDMMGLDRLDGEQDDIPPTLAPATSWVELEERRRTFWGAFAIDAHASISTGWPSLINSSDVTTHMPSSEDAFISGREEQTGLLEDVFKGASYSGFASTIVICRVFKTIMHHVHRSKPHDHPEDPKNGKFWQRHHELDNEVSSAFMFLPEKLRLPRNVRDPAALHLNLNLHASVICLHHAAVEKVEKHRLHESMKHNSIRRLRASAEEIVNIVKLTSPNVGVFKSPLSALSLYCASTVYTYLAKNNADDLTVIDKTNFELLVQGMEVIGRVHQVTKSFLQQTCLDIERNDLSSIIGLTKLSKYREVFGGAHSNIPMLARSAIGRHTEVSPVLPGKLPLKNPVGKVLPANLHLSKHDTIPSFEDSSLECFQAMLGAVTRNIGVSGASNPPDQSNKRKRTSPDSETLTGVYSGEKNDVAIDVGFSGGQDYSSVSQSFFDTKVAMFEDGLHDGIKLPDRTQPSSFYPSIHSYNNTHSEYESTQPAAPFGLGKTLAENTFDLRPFQDRVATPLWQHPDNTMFQQITESMMNDTTVTTGTALWGSLNNESAWSNEPSADLNDRTYEGL